MTALLRHVPLSTSLVLLSKFTNPATNACSTNKYANKYVLAAVCLETSTVYKDPWVGTLIKKLALEE